MQNYKEYFKGKKVTMMGLGLLGRGLNDAKFLAECGADLLVTDLKSEKELASSLKKLKSHKLISYKLGYHDLEDFRNRDFILKAAGVPLDSVYIAEAKKNNIPIEMDESLFAKLAPEVKVVGVTGTRGKTTTTMLIYEILKKAFGKKVHLGGNIKGLATLPLLKKVKAGDMVVMELSSWQLQGFGEAKISPAVSVFTNLMNDHLNYYKGSVDLYFSDKAKICEYQKENDFIICGEKIAEKIKSCGQKIIAKKSDVPKSWKLKIKGEHNLENIACAIKAVKALGVPEKIIKEAVENFSGVEGRLEFLREYRGIKIYNDTTATTPDALAVALKSLRADIKGRGRLITISGGADKKLNNIEVVNHIQKYADYAFLLAGSGTETIKDNLLKKMGDKARVCDSLKLAVSQAIAVAKKGDTLVLSPGFASFGMFKNEFDRGEQFVKLIKRLK